jgi:hypothetical protein
MLTTLILVCAALLVAGYVLIRQNKQAKEAYESAMAPVKRFTGSVLQRFHHTKVEAQTPTN